MMLLASGPPRVDLLRNSSCTHKYYYCSSSARAIILAYCVNSARRRVTRGLRSSSDYVALMSSAGTRYCCPASAGRGPLTAPSAAPFANAVPPLRLPPMMSMNELPACLLRSAVVSARLRATVRLFRQKRRTRDSTDGTDGCLAAPPEGLLLACVVRGGARIVMAQL